MGSSAQGFCFTAPLTSCITIFCLLQIKRINMSTFCGSTSYNFIKYNDF